MCSTTDLPVWVPIPALAEMQVALEQESVAEVTGLDGLRSQEASCAPARWRPSTTAIGNCATRVSPVHRLSQSRAIALDMESATIAANGFRFRVPYGTLLCVSDKPLHGELKLPGMATRFLSQRQVGSAPRRSGMLAMEKLARHAARAPAFAQIAELFGDGVSMTVLFVQLRHIPSINALAETP